jgi:hypothetical protein
MMETAQARAGKHGGFVTRPILNWPAIRRVLPETIVNAVLVEVGDVLTDQTARVLFVQRITWSTRGDNRRPTVPQCRFARAIGRSSVWASDPWLSGTRGRQH